jgi:hypothetical protein
MNAKRIPFCGFAAFVVLAGVLRAEQPAAGCDWPQLTGPNGDNTAPVKGLVDEWPKDGPRLVWSAKIAGGTNKESGVFASPVAAHGKIFVTGRNYEFDPDPAIKQFKASPDILFCLDDKDGKELWRHELPLHGPYMPQGRQNQYIKTCWNTPVLDGGFVYVRSGDGELRCLNANDGKLFWSWPKDIAVLERMITGHQPIQGWFNAASSLVVDALIIFNIYGAGRGRLMALDKKTGEIKWEGNDHPCWGWAASNLIAMDVGGRKVVLTFNSAFDAKTGSNLIHEKDADGKPVTTFAPAFFNWISTVKGTRLLAEFTRKIKEPPASVPAPSTATAEREKKPGTAPKQETGIALIEFSFADDGALKTKTVWEIVNAGEPSFDNGNAYGGPVILGDYIYVFYAQNSGKNNVACYNFADGKR